MKRQQLFKEISTNRQSPQFLHALNRAAARIQHSSRSEQAVLDAFCAEISRLGYRGSLALLSEDGRDLVFRAVTYPKKILRALEKATGLRIDGFHFPREQNPFYAKVLRTGRPVLVQGTAKVATGFLPQTKQDKAPQVADIVGQQNTGAYLPLRGLGKTSGVMSIVTDSISRGDLPALEAIAHHISVALENARLLESTRAAKNQFSRLLENSHDAILQLGPDLRVLFASSACKQVWGYSPAQLIQNYRSAELILPGLPRHLNRAKRSRQAIRLILESKHRKGTPLSLELTVTPLHEDKQPCGFEIIARDVTDKRKWEAALQESEEVFRNLAENSPNMIFINSGGRVVYANKKCEQVMGYTRRQIYSDKFSFLCLIAPQDRSLVLKTLQKHMSGFDVGPQEYGLITKTGRKLSAIHSTKLIRYAGQDAVLGIVTDITELKRAESTLQEVNRKLTASDRQLRRANTQLQESEAKYRQLFNGTTDPVMVHRFTEKDVGRFIEVNDATVRLYGFSRKQLLRVKPTDLNAPESVGPEPVLMELVKKGKALFERTIRTKSGKLIPLEINARRIDLGGEPAVLSVARDISERRKAEEALRESEERYRSFVERANDGIALIQDGQFQFANRRLLEMHGDPNMKYRGKSFLDFVHPCARKDVIDRYQGRLRGLPEPSIYESVGLRADGSSFDLEFNAGLVTYGGRQANLVFVRDITERKKTERALRDSELLNRTTIDSMHEAIHVVDKDFRVILHNQVIADLNRNLGYPRQLIGKTILEAFPYLDPGVLDLYKKVFSTGHPVRTEDETRFPQRSIHTETDRVPVIEDGEVIRVITVIRDVTGHKMAEQEIRQAKETAEEASRAKSDFLTAMSHELRTPLTSILGFAELFLQRKIGNLSDRDLVFVEKIMRNGQHLLTLINSLLDLAKIESGRMGIRIEPVNVKDIVEEVAAAAMPLTKDKPIKMKVSVSEPAPALQTDALRLRQVLFNLVGNAVKFTKKGRVEIRVRRSHTGGKTIRIHIIDTGIGISAEHLSGIFDRFSQIHGSEAKSQGTGIGLAISKSIIELLGGHIEVRSKLNKGSIFTILLPTQADPRLLAKSE